MGDSRITVSLILRNNSKEELNNSSSVPKTHHEIRLSADSSLRNMMDIIRSDVLRNNPFGKSLSFFDSSSPLCDASDTITAYDCTYHPPKDITSSIHRYDQHSGIRSITLQTMGWFPSGHIVVFETDNEEARDSMLKNDVHFQEDTKCDHPLRSNKTEPEQKVVLTSIDMTASKNEERLLPSQMFQTVASQLEKNRIKEDIRSNSQRKKAPPSHQQQHRRTEQQRQQSLDLQIKRLDDLHSKSKKGKKKKTSLQVQRMLIKSRAEGDKKLRQEDRFFIETVLLVDIDRETGEEEVQLDGSSPLSVCHRFYSKMVTIGRIASSVANTIDPVDGRSSEFLVGTSSKEEDGGEGFVYRRLPNTMHLYEAEASGYVNQFDRVIVRVFEVGDGDNATPLIS